MVTPNGVRVATNEKAVGRLLQELAMCKTPVRAMATEDVILNTVHLMEIQLEAARETMTEAVSSLKKLGGMTDKDEQFETFLEVRDGLEQAAKGGATNETGGHDDGHD